MIATLDGVLRQRGTPCLVEVGGIGFSVTIAAGAVGLLPPVGDRVSFHTHLAVREDGWTLFGFLDPDELELFRLLISVSGVGPKLAMGMLSGATAPAIAHALHTGDKKALSALQGIGPKSAARLVVELGNRIPASLLVDAPAAAVPLAGHDDSVGTPVAMELLASMGLTGTRADEILRLALKNDPALAEEPVDWVRAALRQLT